MAEEEGVNEGQEPEGGQAGGEGAGGGTDWKAMARKWERLAKENSEKAKSYDELQEASKTELQKAREAAEKAKVELDGYKAKAELSAARSRVAKSSGIPEELVFGATEEEMEANAKAVAAFARPRSGARTGHSGRFDASAGSGDALSEAKLRLAQQMFGSGE